MLTFEVAGQKTKDPEDLRRHTLTRWLYNEKAQLARRYVDFNPYALAEAASETVGVKCVKINKISESGFNKVLNLTFENGREAIARLPFPLAGPPHLMTASEVATMNVIKNSMGIPIPAVLTWSSQAQSTPVGAEFVLMDKPQGERLDAIWDSLVTDKQAHGLDKMSTLALNLTKIRNLFPALRLSHFGSIYFEEDVEGRVPHTIDFIADPAIAELFPRGYAIGPSVDWDLWRGQRQNLDLDRGPWNDTLSYLTAVVQNEQLWLRLCARPRDPSDPFYRGSDDNSPSAHIELLDQLLDCLPHIIPDQSLCFSSLWHPEFGNSSNIFVRQPSLEVTSVIDWQWTTAAPLFMQAVNPRSTVHTLMCSRMGPGKLGDGAVLPEILEGLSGSTAGADRDRAALIHHEYRGTLALASRNVPSGAPHAPLLDAVARTTPHLATLLDPVHCATRTWHRGIVHLRAALMRLQHAWPEVAHDGAPCPLHYTEGEMRATEVERARAMRYRSVMEEARVHGIEEDGEVAAENYPRAAWLNEWVKTQWEGGEFEGGPFPHVDGGRSFQV